MTQSARKDRWSRTLTIASALVLSAVGCLTVLAWLEDSAKFRPLADANAIKSLEEETQFPMPHDVAMVARRVDERSRQGMNCVWIFYSREGFAFNPKSVARLHSYCEKEDPCDLAMGIAPYLSYLGKSRLRNAIEARSMIWQWKDLDFYGSLLRTNRGEFLDIQRIIQR